jgi:hypothetical protein
MLWGWLCKFPCCPGPLQLQVHQRHEHDLLWCKAAQSTRFKPWCRRCCRAYSLTATDAHGRSFEFVIKSWANGTEHRRVYVLEQAAPFIKAHCLAAGDAVGVCTNGSGSLTILANTPEVARPSGMLQRLPPAVEQSVLAHSSRAQPCSRLKDVTMEKASC